jgi:hypothetical protein
MYIATHIFTYLPTYLPVHQSVYQSIYLPACLCSEVVQCDRVDHDFISCLWAFVKTPSAWDRHVTRRLFAQDNTNTWLCVHDPIVTFVYFRVNCLCCPYSYRRVHLDCLCTPTAPVNLGLGQLARGSVNGIEH